MSQYEEVFMAGFFDALGAEKTAQEEMPVLDRALANLGLLEEEKEEAVDMPILKRAFENLGLIEEEEEEASSMLEALAIKHGPAVIAEREKVAAEEALEKDAAGMLRTKATSVLKHLGNVSGVSNIRKGLALRRGAKEIQEGAASAGRRPSAKASAAITKRMKAAKEQGKRGALKAGAGIAVAGGTAAAIAALRKKKKKAKKGKK